MQAGVIAVPQVDARGALTSASIPGAGTGFFNGGLRCCPFVVTPNVRFCNSGSVLDREGVRSLMPGVM